MADSIQEVTVFKLGRALTSSRPDSLTSFSLACKFSGLRCRNSGNGSNPFVLPEGAYVRPLSDTVSVGIAVNGNGGMNTH